MPDLKYGFAEISDLKDLLALYATLRPGDPPYGAGEAEAMLKEVLAQQHIRIIVAKIEGAAVATCMLALLANFASRGRPIGYLEHVVTTERFRGQGIARGMLAYALDVAWQHNCCKVVLLSGSHRDSAHRLYESVGFNGERERGFVIKSPG